MGEEAKDEEQGVELVKPTKTSDYIRTKMGKEVEGPAPTMYDLTQDEFEYDSDLDSEAEGEAAGVEVDAGAECCGFFCKFRSGLCCGAFSGLTIVRPPAPHPWPAWLAYRRTPAPDGATPALWQGGHPAARSAHAGRPRPRVLAVGPSY